MKPKFKKVIEERDLVSVRLYLGNELLLDPRGKTFHEMLSLAESTFEDSLYEVDNNITYSNDSSTWDENTLYAIKNDLDDNFSRERLQVYEHVAKFVLKEKAVALDKEASASHTSRQTYEDNANNESEDSDSSKKVLYGGITAGGALLTAVGYTVGVAAVIIGGFLFYKEMKK